MLLLWKLICFNQTERKKCNYWSGFPLFSMLSVPVSQGHFAISFLIWTHKVYQLQEAQEVNTAHLKIDFFIWGSERRRKKGCTELKHLLRKKTNALKAFIEVFDPRFEGVSERERERESSCDWASLKEERERPWRWTQWIREIKGKQTYATTAGL